MKVIAVSGPRKLDDCQFDRVEYHLQQQEADLFLVGDASGVDSIVRRWLSPRVYRVEGRQPKDFAIRTLRMISDLDDFGKAGNDVSLIAFPNKECHPKCKPSSYPSGHGSGTWLAIAAAKHRGISLDIQPIAEFDLPIWLSQLSLF